jgi:hypothetical protein
VKACEHRCKAVDVVRIQRARSESLAEEGVSSRMVQSARTHAAGRHNRPEHAGCQSHVQALRRALEATTGQAVELIETHISCVLLAGEFAYKIKKPIRLPFVDYSRRAKHGIASARRK